MAQSNAERQRRYRARLKDAAEWGDAQRADLFAGRDALVEMAKREGGRALILEAQVASLRENIAKVLRANGKLLAEVEWLRGEVKRLKQQRKGRATPS